METRNITREAAIERAAAHLSLIGFESLARDVVAKGRRFDFVAFDPQGPTVVFVDMFDGDPDDIGTPLTESERREFEMGASALVVGLAAITPEIPSVAFRLDRVCVADQETDHGKVVHAMGVSRWSKAASEQEPSVKRICHADSVVDMAASRVVAKGCELLAKRWLSDSGRDIDLIYVEDGATVFAWVLLTFGPECVWGEDLLCTVPAPSWLTVVGEYLSEHPELDEAKWRIDVFSFCVTGPDMSLVRHHIGAYENASEEGEAA